LEEASGRGGEEGGAAAEGMMKHCRGGRGSGVTAVGGGRRA